MSPIERIRQKDAALRALGLRQLRDHKELKVAWKRVALETHPDRMGGSSSQFQRAKAAYEYLASRAELSSRSKVFPSRPTANS